MPSAHVFVGRAAKPFRGAVDYLNDALGVTLRSLGYRVRVFSREVIQPRNELPPSLIPLATASCITRTSLAADLAFYCEEGLQLMLPSAHRARRSVVFFHGLAYSSGCWLANPAIDLYCANSGYLAEVLQSLLAFPDWRNRRCLDPRAFDVVRSVVLPVPCVDHPDGYDSRAADLPETAFRALDSDDALGHAVQARKMDPSAVYAIMLYLNEWAHAHGDRRRFRCFVTEADKRRLALTGARMSRQQNIDDVFIGVPPIKNRHLMKIMSSSRFALAYNVMPDSFGFYPLESVFHGCPVYTNGCGNYRHLLPDGKGIFRHETEAMARGDLSEYELVARRIYEHVVRPSVPAAACRKGRAWLIRSHSRAAFRRSLEAALRAPRPLEPTSRFEDLVLGLSPMVRLWSGKTGWVVSDYGTRKLPRPIASLMKSSIGEPCRAILRSSTRVRSRLHRLFELGMLSLQVP